MLFQCEQKTPERKKRLSHLSFPPKKMDCRQKRFHTLPLIVPELSTSMMVVGPQNRQVILVSRFQQDSTITPWLASNLGPSLLQFQFQLPNPLALLLRARPHTFFQNLDISRKLRDDLTLCSDLITLCSNNLVLVLK